MKWLPFFILAALATVCQITICPAIAIHYIRPDVMFILVVHYALWGPWPEAAIAGWVLGFLLGTQTSDEREIGLHAFCYGAAAWAIIRVRQIVYREHPLTQILITLVFMLMAQVLICSFRWWKSPELLGWHDVWWPALLTALYTAGVAPYVQWPLARLSRWTGLRPGQRAAGYR